MENQFEIARWEQHCQQWNTWTQSSPNWSPMQQLHTSWKLIEPRIKQLSQQLNRVLVVGMLGGTGTGKSTLINAIIGKRLCQAGDVQRPTTTSPTVLHHPTIETDFLPTREWGAKLIAADLPLLEQVIVIDCPDPDTQGNDTESEYRNRELLQKILPHCDVLICTGTAQKYKSQAVFEELKQQAAGKALIFVQTHAKYDVDLRDDWRKLLESQGFQVPVILRLDSEDVLQAIEQKIPLPSEYRELKRLLETELDRRGHTRIRRSNAINLLHQFAKQTEQILDPYWAKIQTVDQTLDAEAARLWKIAHDSLQRQLQTDRAAWRTRLLGETAARWGGGPFGIWLRCTTSLWSWLKWLPILRARGTAGVLLTGGLAVTQAISNRLQESSTNALSLKPDNLGWTTGELAQTRSVIQGAADAANLSCVSTSTKQVLLERDHQLAATMVQLEQQLSTAWDQTVQAKVQRATKIWRQWFYELPLCALGSWLFGRWGYTFFYKHLWLGEAPTSWDVILQGVVWLVILAWLLRCVLSWSLLRGWYSAADAALQKVNPSALTKPMFDYWGEALTENAQTIQQCRRLRAELQTFQSQTEATDKSVLAQLVG